MLAVILLLAAAGIAVLVFALPLHSLYASRAAELADRQALAWRLAKVAADLPVLRARLAALRSSARASRLMLQGVSDPIASASLQARIQELAGPTGAIIASTETLPAEPRGAYHRIGLRVGLTSEYATVVKLLAAIENATPPLIVDNLHISAGAIQGVQQGIPRLAASFEVYGFRSGETQPAGKP